MRCILNLQEGHKTLTILVGNLKGRGNSEHLDADAKSLETDITETSIKNVMWIHMAQDIDHFRIGKIRIIY
jgi:hypothetical protein